MGMNNDDNDEPGEIQIYLWRFIPTTNIYVDDDADGQWACHARQCKGFVGALVAQTWESVTVLCVQHTVVFGI